jgi:hypothetical protein
MAMWFLIFAAMLSRSMLHYLRDTTKPANALPKMLEASSGYRDFDGYAILFLRRHALEFYMKSIVYR